MASGKIYNDIKKMNQYLLIIEQYNNFGQLGAEEDIKYLKDKVESLLKIKDTKELIEEFKWCSKMINMYYDNIEHEFKKEVFTTIKKEHKKEFGL